MAGPAWMSALGGVVLYEVDLPACCTRTARSHEQSFGCPVCGAMWQSARPVEPEHDAFVRGDEEHKGAA